MRGRATAEETGWQRIVALYDALAQLSPSPIVELNRVERAAALTDNARERELSLQRARACGRG